MFLWLLKVQSRFQEEVARYFAPPQKRSVDTVKIIEITMPGLDPADISVVRTGAILSVFGQDNPLDVVGHKYHERYELKKEVIVDSVCYHDPLLRIILMPGRNSTVIEHYAVNDLRNGEQDGHSGNARSV